MIENKETGMPPVPALQKAQKSKLINIGYWSFNILLIIGFSSSAFIELTHYPSNVANNIKLGYPPYFITILATAKIAGVIVLLLPGLPRLKEWAYAGFFIDVISAFWSENAIGDHQMSIKALIAFPFLLAAYLLYRKSTIVSSRAGQ